MLCTCWCFQIRNKMRRWHPKKNNTRYFALLNCKHQSARPRQDIWNCHNLRKIYFYIFSHFKFLPHFGHNKIRLWPAAAGTKKIFNMVEKLVSTSVPEPQRPSDPEISWTTKRICCVHFYYFIGRDTFCCHLKLWINYT